MIICFLTLYWCKDVGTRRFPRLGRLPTFATLWGSSDPCSSNAAAASLHFLGQILYNFLDFFLKFYSIYTKTLKTPLFIIVSEDVIGFFYYTHLTLFLKRVFRVGKHTSPSWKAYIPKSESIHPRVGKHISPSWKAYIPELESILSRVGKHSFGSRKALTLEAQSIDFRGSEHWL